MILLNKLLQIKTKKKQTMHQVQLSKYLGMLKISVLSYPAHEHITTADKIFISPTLYIQVLLYELHLV